MTARIHPTSVVAASAVIGDRTQIWLHCQIREDVRIGEDCILGKNVYVETGVQIGSRVKIQNNVSVFAGVTLEDGVFVGPHVCFTNDRVPRAVNPDGSLKTASDWHIDPTRVCTGAAIGANSTIVCGVTIGAWALIGAGSVVTRSVPAYALVAGNPARRRGWVTPHGERATFDAAGLFVGSDGFTLRLVRDADGERVEACVRDAGA
ncbi:MAG: N-acetyltransferase [Deltaproteobacteria bacterium]|nr:MAG: N-acetyltransferase [Deltaproteobacteria bacterium]